MPPITDVYSLLTFEEGNRLFVYDDYDGSALKPGQRVVGHPSIGVGRALDVKGITPAESVAMLRDDVTAWYGALHQLTWFAYLDGVRQAAMVSMAHVMGVAGLETFTGMIGALQSKEWQQAANEVLSSKWATEEPDRAKRVSEMLLTGQWPVV
jgi:lysozyme